MIHITLQSIWKNKPAPIETGFKGVPAGQKWDYQLGKWVPLSTPTLLTSTANSSNTEEKSSHTVGYNKIIRSIDDANRLIELELRNCNFTVGDIVVPKFADDKKKYGRLKVVAIKRSITEMDWRLPLDHDAKACPYNVYMKRLDNDMFLRSNPGFVTKEIEVK